MDTTSKQNTGDDQDGVSKRTRILRPQLTFSEDTGSGSHSPLALKVLTKQAIVMDSESDWSDIDFNTFAQRDLRSPRLQAKTQSDDEDGTWKRKWDDVQDGKSPSSPSKKQKEMDFPDQDGSPVVRNLDMSASSVDSAVGSSLNNTSESLNDSQDAEDSQNTSGESIPHLHFSDSSLSKQFRKFASDANSVRSMSFSNEGMEENLILQRLPDENLGMRLSIEGGKHGGNVKSVSVKSVVEDGAAYRASGSSVGICKGDEILEVNGTNLRRLNHIECLNLFKNIPERVHLVVRRNQPPPHRRMSGHGQMLFENQEPEPSPLQQLGQVEGFDLQEVNIRKGDGETLGISIVPSYGTTRNFYQIKRLLPSGACARSGKLQIGDRLLYCNGQLLKGLTQAQCLNALSQGGHDLTFQILRQTGGETSLEISTNLTRHAQSDSGLDEVDILKVKEKPNSGVNLQGYKVSDSEGNSSRISEVFAQQHVKLAFTQPFPSHQLSDDSESMTDSSMSSPVKENKVVNMDSNQQLIDVGGFEIITTQTGQLDNAYVVDTPAVDLETTPRDWDDNEFECVTNGELPPIIEGIPPPMEFADTQDSAEEGPPGIPGSAPPDLPSCNPPGIPQGQGHAAGPPPVVQDVPVTNIDDLLGLDDDASDLVLESNTVQYSNPVSDMDNVSSDGAVVDGFEVVESVRDVKSVETVQEMSNAEGQVNDLLFDLASDSSASLQSVISSQTTESNTNSSQHCDLIDTSTDGNVTSLQVTSIDDFLSIGNVTQIPVADDAPQISEDSSVESSPHVTTKTVNQTIVTSVDVGSDSEHIQSASTAPVSASTNADGEHTSNSAVIEVNGNVVKKSTVITINSNKPKVQSSSPLHFVPPEQSSVRDDNGEEIIQPMKMKKEQGGVRVFENGAAESVKSQRRQLDPDAKRDLADILLQLTKTSDQAMKKKTACENSSVAEENIVPTKISREDAKVVLGVFEKWLSGGHNPPASVSPFKKMVVNVLESKPNHEEKMVANVLESKAKPKVTKIRVGSASPLHVLPPTIDTDSSDQGEAITPVLMRRDNKGVRSFESGSAHSSPGIKHRVLDETAKKDLANILSGLQKSFEKSNVKTNKNDTPTIEEQAIVAEKISKEDAKTLMNVFSTWLQKDDTPAKSKKSKTNPFKKLVSNVIDAFDDSDKEDSPKEEVLTVTKDENKTVIKQEQIVVESKPTVESEVIVSSKTSSSFSPPKPSMTKESTPDVVEASSQPPLPKVAAPVPAPKPSDVPVPAPKPSAAEPQKSAALDISVKLRTPSSPKLAPRTVNRFSTGSLPPLNVSKAPPKIAGFKSTGLQFSTASKPASKPEYQKMRKEDGPFQVDVLKGIVGLGLKLQASPDGFTKVSDIQKNSPVDKNGQIKVGDYVLSINTTTLTGQTDGRIQQVLRLLPRGLAKIVVSAIPPSDADTEAHQGATDSLASSGDTSPGRTSPFGVRLGAKPFNTAESRSATVTSPLMRDSGFFEKKTSTFPKQTGGDETTVRKSHVSTIDVSKQSVEVKETKAEDKHISKVEVTNSQEEPTVITRTVKTQVQENTEQKNTVPQVVKVKETVETVVMTQESSGPGASDETTINRTVMTETVTKKSEEKAVEGAAKIKRESEPVQPVKTRAEVITEEETTVTERLVESAVQSKQGVTAEAEATKAKPRVTGPEEPVVSVEMAKEESVPVEAPKQTPVRPPRAAPRHAQPAETTTEKVVQSVVEENVVEPVAEETVIEPVVEPVVEKLPEVKTPPKVPPKPKSRPSLADTSPVPQRRKFVSNVNVQSPTEEKGKDSQKFVSNISVAQEASSPPRGSKSEKHIQNEDVDEGVVADVKPKSADRTPPPVPPKPRSSSSSSSVSTASLLSDDLHYENEVDSGIRRRRRSSNSSEKSSGSIMSDKITEEPYVPSRRKSEHAPEKQSVKQKMAAFEKFQKNEENETSKSANFVIPKRKISTSSQGSDGQPGTKTRTESTSKKDTQEEDGVFIVSRISIKSKTAPDSTKEEPTSPTSPVSPTSPKMNSALMPKSRTDTKPRTAVEPKPRTALEPKPRTSHLEPKKRTGLSEPKTKPEQQSHHHAVPKTSSSIFKPTGLERLKNVVGQKSDSGEVAHSSSPDGTYKIGPVKINSALSPRKLSSSSSEEPTSPGHTYSSNLHSGEGRSIISKLSGKKSYSIYKEYAMNDNAPAPVSAKVVHINKPSAPTTDVKDKTISSSSTYVKDNVSSAHSTYARNKNTSAPNTYVKDKNTFAPSTCVKDTNSTSTNDKDNVSSAPSTYVKDSVSSSFSSHSRSVISYVTDHEHVDVSPAATVTQSDGNQGVDIDVGKVEAVKVEVVQNTHVKEEATTVPENEHETENVKIQMEVVTDQIRVPSSNENVIEYKDGENEKEEEESLISNEKNVEKIISGNAGFAEKVVEASMEAAKQELVKQQSNDTDETDVDVEKTEQDDSKFEPGQIISEDDIQLAVDIQSPTEQRAEEEIEIHASEIVAATLETAKMRLGNESQETSTPPASPPPLPGAGPPRLPSGPPPPVPVPAEIKENLSMTQTSTTEAAPPVTVAENVSVEVTPDQQATVQKDVEVEVVVNPDQQANQDVVSITQTTANVLKTSVQNDVEDEVVVKPVEIKQEEVRSSLEDDSEAPPPLPSELPPIPTTPAPKPEAEEDNNWVEEIEQIAAQESKFDLLLNLDSKEKVVLDQNPAPVETPSSDSDSGVVLQMSSPSSAISDGADVQSPVGSDGRTIVTETVRGSDVTTVVTETVRDVNQLVSTSVEPQVESAVSLEDVRGRRDTGTDSGVESSGEVSNKTVTVQYSSHAPSHEQDSFSSVDSLHDITPSVSSTQTTVSVEKVTEKVSHVLHANKQSDSNSVSVTQVSNSQGSPAKDAVKGSESKVVTRTTRTEKIITSTPTKDSPKSKESAFEANVSSIQFNSSSLSTSNSQSLSTSKSNVLNKSFSASPKSKSSLSKRKWRLTSCGSGEGSSDISLSELMDVTNTSLVSQDELSTLIGQANQSMDKTGMSLEDEIVVIVFARDPPEQPLGLDLRDGILRSKVVSSVKPGSLAEKDQRVQVKDCLMSVNSKSVEDMSAEDVMKLLAEPSPHVTLVLSRRGVPSTISNGHSTAEAGVNGNGTESDAPSQQGPGTFEVIMKKGVTGVGFCLEGGKGSPKGDMPILIKRIFKGGPAEKCGQLKVKDEILKVNDTDFTTLRHYEAWNHLKFLPDGDVHIAIKRN